MNSVAADPALPLTFSAALELAERNAPQLTAEAAKIDATRSAAIPAGELPDPRLFFGIEGFPVSGPNAGTFDQDDFTMETIGVMQEVPNAGKRKARRQVAVAAIDVATADQVVERSKVRQQTAQAWLSRYYIERRIVVLSELDKENTLLAETVRAQLASGQGMVTDAVMPRQEAAMLAGRRDELEQALAQARASLRRWVGDAVDAPSAADLPPFVVEPQALQQRLHRHPNLLRFVPLQSKAEAEVHEAQASKRPDWGVEFAFQRRNPDFGNLVSLQFSFDLPLFTSRRQDPQIAAELAEVTQLHAERESMLREHVAELESGIAEHARLVRAVARQHDTVMPLVREKVDLALASYSGGEGDLPAILAARRELIDARLREVDLQGERDAVAARLLFTYGEEAE